MHSATSRLDNARKELQRAKEAKLNLHRNWRAFLCEAVKRWEGHTQKFATEGAELQEAIDTATAAFHEARENFEASKEKLTAHDREKYLEEISDEEQLSEALPCVAAGLQQVLTFLTQIKENKRRLFKSLPGRGKEQGEQRNGGFGGGWGGFAIYTSGPNFSCHDAFWQGGQIDPNEEVCSPRQFQDPFVLTYVAVRQWTHPVLEEEDFKSEWTARECGRPT